MDEGIQTQCQMVQSLDYFNFNPSQDTCEYNLIYDVVPISLKLCYYSIAFCHVYYVL